MHRQEQGPGRQRVPSHLVAWDYAGGCVYEQERMSIIFLGLDIERGSLRQYIACVNSSLWTNSRYSHAITDVTCTEGFGGPKRASPLSSVSSLALSGSFGRMESFFILQYSARWVHDGVCQEVDGSCSLGMFLSSGIGHVLSHGDFDCKSGPGVNMLGHA